MVIQQKLRKFPDLPNITQQAAAVFTRGWGQVHSASYILWKWKIVIRKPEGSTQHIFTLIAGSGTLNKMLIIFILDIY